MRRTPNYRFSVTKDRTITPFESALGSIKRHMPYPFTRTTKKQASFKGKSPVSSIWGGRRTSSNVNCVTKEPPYSMGSKRQKRQDHIDLGDETKSIRQNNGATARGRIEDWTSTTPKNGENDESSEGQESSDAQTDLRLDPYLALVKDLRMKLEASQTVTEHALVFYTNHQVEIQKVDTTRQQLHEMTTMCDDYRITITSLQRIEGEKERKLAKEIAAIQEDRRELDVMKEEADRHKQQLVEEKIEFEDIMRRKEAEQLLNLQEEKGKFESEYKRQHAKQVEDLGKATKKSQDDDRKKILDLQNKNKELAQSLEEQRRKLKDAEKRCKDTEKLRSLSETEVEDLSQRLKMAENEFGLNANSTEYLHVSKYSNPQEASLMFYSGSEFLKIQNEVRTVSLRYVEQLKVDNPDAAVHDKLEEADSDFSSVPISNSLVSKELCLAHFQRVISSQLQAILWQPFSSEVTVEDPIQTSLLNQTYNRLAESSQKSTSSLRAARTCAALIIRSLHSQSTSTKRAEKFTNNIVKVLSLLLNPKILPALRKDLTRLATSAISLWSIVQGDECELQVHPTFDPASFERPEEDINITGSRVFVLFPSVTAQICPRIGNAYPVSPPGGWVYPKPELQIEEICIHKGVGLPEWDQLVRAGEDEEVQRRRKQEIESNEKKRRELEEEIEELKKPDLGHKRAISYNRRNSVAAGKSTTLSPSLIWLGAKIPEKE